MHSLQFYLFKKIETKELYKQKKKTIAADKSRERSNMKQTSETNVKS